jgi:hypothetical protein
VPGDPLESGLFSTLTVSGGNTALSDTDDTSLVIHARIVDIGRPSFDPFGLAVCLSVPAGWPVQKLIRGRMDQSWSQLETLELRPCPQFHPAAQTELAHINRRLGRNFSAVEAMQSDDPIFDTFKRRVAERSRVVVPNPKALDSRAIDELSIMLPAATMSAHMAGITDAPPTHEFTVDRPSRVTEQHLRSLGVPDSKIARFASMPENAPKCYAAFARMCDNVRLLAQTTLDMRSLYSKNEDASHLLPRLALRMADAARAVLDMFQVRDCFRSTRSYPFVCLAYAAVRVRVCSSTCFITALSTGRSTRPTRL